MQINDSLFSKLETLAKLEFQPQERDKLKQDLENILQMVKKLESINTEGVTPLVYLNDPSMTTRQDHIDGQLNKAVALSNAPENNDDFITIPKVIDL
jgi:aspartyl-tRNA(Asn)/glutamyl-tRNA(Gln) amidotransferase subunit C